MSQSITETTSSSSRKRQSLGPANVTVQRTAPGSRMSFGPGFVSRTNVRQVYSAPAVSRAPGMATKISKTAVENVIKTRGKEKQEMGQLNNKFVSYIEAVGRLEAQNQCLLEEINALRKIKGYCQDKIREEYEDELRESKDALLANAKELAALETKINRLEDDNDVKDQEIKALRDKNAELEKQIGKLNSIIGENEGEICHLRNSHDAMERQLQMLKDDNARLQSEIARISDDRDAAVQKQLEEAHINHLNNEDMQFKTDVLVQENEELRHLVDELKNCQPNIEKVWKSEFQSTLNEIQQHCNDRVDMITKQLEQQYADRVQQLQAQMRPTETDGGILKTENRSLKSQLNDGKSRLTLLQNENDDLRRQLANLKDQHERDCEECEKEKGELRERIAELELELDSLEEEMKRLGMDHSDMQLEIACYKKLLDGEEAKMARSMERNMGVQSEGGAQLAGIIAGGGGRGGGSGGGSMSMSGGGSGGGGSMSQQSTLSESTGMVRITRSSSCNLQIKDIEPTGEFITLHNNSKRNEFKLDGYVIERKGQNKKLQASLRIDSMTLAPNQELRLIAEDYPVGERLPSDYLAKGVRRWGRGSGTLEIRESSDAKVVKCTSNIEYN